MRDEKMNEPEFKSDTDPRYTIIPDSGWDWKTGLPPSEYVHEINRLRRKLETLRSVIDALNENIRDCEKILWASRDENQDYEAMWDDYIDKYHQ